MDVLTFDSSHIIDKVISKEALKAIQLQVNLADQALRTGIGKGSEYTGWLDLPTHIDKEELARIKASAKKIQSDSEVFVVVGIGGSYLGAKAAINALSHSFYNYMAAQNNDMPEIYFAGTNLSSKYYHDLLDVIGERDFSINVISKSGTTTEPSIGLRILKAALIERYGVAEANKRIYATTDGIAGALKQEADSKGYESFVIPDNIGGRFSVLTAVGLLPIAVSGQDIDELLAGAGAAQLDYHSAALEGNNAYLYAAIRNILYRQGYQIEILANYEPSLAYFSEWWKQLFGESEGKEKQGIFPASVNFTTDLHSMGQFLQDGMRNLFETVLYIDQSPYDLTIPIDSKAKDGLDYIEGKALSDINKSAYEGSLLAHEDGGVPVMSIHLKEINAYTLGYLFYFFELSVSISAYLNGVNPFNQPGVEDYKKNMFALLGKTEYSERKEALEKRMK